jgi:2'-5' RNA ligase
MANETAILVPFELPAPLEAVRMAGDPVARLGIPAHVTVLYPFVPVVRLDDGVRDVVGRIAASRAAWIVRFTRIERFTDVVWLAPEPSAPFDELIAAATEAFPDHPPYGGIHDVVVPHMTLAAVTPGEIADAVASEATPHLPFEREAAALALWVEGPDGRWRQDARYPFASSSDRDELPVDTPGAS